MAPATRRYTGIVRRLFGGSCRTGVGSTGSREDQPSLAWRFGAFLLTYEAGESIVGRNASGTPFAVTVKCLGHVTRSRHKHSVSATTWTSRVTGLQGDALKRIHGGR